VPSPPPSATRAGDGAPWPGGTLPPPTPFPPVPRRLSAGAVVAWSEALTQADARSREVARQVLDHGLATAKELLEALGVGGVRIESFSVAGRGGASGLAESVVEMARLKGASTVVVGSRCMGAVKRQVMSLAGLGSVSDYLIHHLPCPVAVVRHRDGEGPEDLDTAVPGPEDPGAAAPGAAALLLPARKVCVAVDASEPSAAALRHALSRVYRPGDELHLVSVAHPVPVPVMDEMLAPVLDAWERDRREALAAAQRCCEAAIAEAVAAGVPRESVWYRPLVPEGGASEVAASLLHYARSNRMSLLVLGSRGMGALRGGLMACLGLGSVSLYAAHHSDRPVVVCKHPGAVSPPPAGAELPPAPAPAPDPPGDAPGPEAAA